jgi:D-alanine-D-alanine ligase
MTRVRVAVLAGGRSSEHAISLASARGVLEALDPDRYEVRQLAIGRDGRWELGTGEDRSSGETLPIPTKRTPAPLGPIDVVLPILHGPFGEDGTVQGLLELADVAYVGPGVLASALCMDKDVFKRVMRDQGIPAAEHVALRLGDPVRNPFGYPVFVKPARLGSSVGISKVREEAELEEAVALARRHDEKVLVEEFVPGTEVEVALLGNLPRPTASLPGQVVSHLADWYARAQELAVQAFVATECEGMGRADFFVRESDGEIVMNELNTIPGFTPTSFYTRLFEASGWTYSGLLDELIRLALERHERRSGLEY